jgi:hypothetical protein
MSTNPFAVRKWVHDPAARRRSLKALKALGGAINHIERTWTPLDGFGDFDWSREDIEAWRILTSASKAVADDEMQAHLTASRC